MHCKILCLYFSPKTMTILIKKILTVGHSAYIIITSALLQTDKVVNSTALFIEWSLLLGNKLPSTVRLHAGLIFILFFAYVYFSFSVSRISCAVFMSFSWKALWKPLLICHISSSVFPYFQISPVVFWKAVHL